VKKLTQRMEPHCVNWRVAHLKPREGVPHPLWFSKGAFFAPEFPRCPPSPYLSNLLPALIKTPTAPWPVPGMFHQLPRHRIRMHVVQFLLHLAAAIHVEIIEPSLPKSHWPVLLPRKWKLELRRQFSSLSLPHRSRRSLLQNLHNLRWCPVHGFADQQMHMLGHQHIPHQRELVPRPHFPQDFNERHLGAQRIQKRSSLVATKSNEVQLLSTVVAL
jgi:hypothetical protein